MTVMPGWLPDLARRSPAIIVAEAYPGASDAIESAVTRGKQHYRSEALPATPAAERLADGAEKAASWAIGRI